MKRLRKAQNETPFELPHDPKEALERASYFDPTGIFLNQTIALWHRKSRDVREHYRHIESLAD
jgi:hypothetical protein